MTHAFGNTWIDPQIATMSGKTATRRADLDWLGGPIEYLVKGHLDSVGTDKTNLVNVKPRESASKVYAALSKAVEKNPNAVNTVLGLFYPKPESNGKYETQYSVLVYTVTVGDILDIAKRTMDIDDILNHAESQAREIANGAKLTPKANVNPMPVYKTGEKTRKQVSREIDL